MQVSPLELMLKCRFPSGELGQGPRLPLSWMLQVDADAVGPGT